MSGKGGERSGRASTIETDENTDRVKEIVPENRKKSLAVKLLVRWDFHFGHCRDVSKENLAVHRITAKIVPQNCSLSFVCA